MQTQIQCDIVSAEESIFSGRVTMVYASGELGDLGIAPRHAPLITRLRPGEVRVALENGGEEFYFVSGGILEVQPHKVTVLADSATRARDIDEAAAQEAKRKAEEALHDRNAEIDLAQAQAQLAASVAQLRAVEKLRRTRKH